MMASLVLDLLLLALFVGVGFKLDGDARRHLKDPNKAYWGVSPLWSPQEFTEQGNVLRLRALRFWLVGFACLIIYALVF